MQVPDPPKKWTPNANPRQAASAEILSQEHRIGVPAVIVVSTGCNSLVSQAYAVDNGDEEVAEGEERR